MGYRLTKKGKEDLVTLRKSLSQLMVEKSVPFKCRLFGFPFLTVRNREELFGRIQMINDILKVEEEKNGED